MSLGLGIFNGTQIRYSIRVNGLILKILGSDRSVLPKELA